MEVRYVVQYDHETKHEHWIHEHTHTHTLNNSIIILSYIYLSFLSPSRRDDDDDDDVTTATLRILIFLVIVVAINDPFFSLANEATRSKYCNTHRSDRIWWILLEDEPCWRTDVAFCWSWLPFYGCLCTVQVKNDKGETYRNRTERV